MLVNLRSAPLFQERDAAAAEIERLSRQLNQGCATLFDCEIPAFNIAQLAKTFEERRQDHHRRLG
jgi:hypothetical protein